MKLPRTARPLVSRLILLSQFVLLPLPAMAGPNSEAKILIHLSRADKVMPCTDQGLLPTCDAIVTTGEWQAGAPFYHCPLLVTDGDATSGLASLTCGIDYPVGEVYLQFASCSASLISFPGPNGQWPAAGSGVILDWDPEFTGCQRFEPGGVGTGVVAIAGSFYIAPYLEGATPPIVIAITPHPTFGLASVESCHGDLDVVETTATPGSPSRLGRVGISTSGSAVGYSPCGQVSVVGSTWGAIKALAR